MMAGELFWGLVGIVASDANHGHPRLHWGYTNMFSQLLSQCVSFPLVLLEENYYKPTILLCKRCFPLDDYAVRHDDGRLRLYKTEQPQLAL